MARIHRLYKRKDFFSIFARNATLSVIYPFGYLGFVLSVQERTKRRDLEFCGRVKNVIIAGKRNFSQYVFLNKTKIVRCLRNILCYMILRLWIYYIIQKGEKQFIFTNIFEIAQLNSMFAIGDSLSKNA